MSILFDGNKSLLWPSKLVCCAAIQHYVQLELFRGQATTAETSASSEGLRVNTLNIRACRLQASMCIHFATYRNSRNYATLTL